jgi:peptidase S24-like protein
MMESREDHKLQLAAEALSAGHTIRLQAQGTSMLPSIWPGDVLSIERKPGREIVPGDIVLVAKQSRFFVHRLIEKHDARWITRGDSLPQNDELAPEVQVLGKVSLIHKKSRTTVPNPRPSPLSRALAWMLCEWDAFRNVALRIHSIWQRRVE